MFFLPWQTHKQVFAGSQGQVSKQLEGRALKLTAAMAAQAQSLA